MKFLIAFTGVFLFLNMFAVNVKINNSSSYTIEIKNIEIAPNTSKDLNMEVDELGNITVIVKNVWCKSLQLEAQSNDIFIRHDGTIVHNRQYYSPPEKQETSHPDNNYQPNNYGHRYPSYNQASNEWQCIMM